MKYYSVCKRFVRISVLLLAVSLLAPGALADAAPIPRILLVGDSWTGFLLAFRSFRSVMPEYAGLDRWVEVGNRTAVMGARAFELHDPAYLATLTDELTRYPNIDVVVMTLGGNDFMRGLPNVLPWNPGRTVSFYDWWRDNTDGNPDNDWDADLLYSRLKADIAFIVDYILAVRPDIRVLILSYDYGARPPKPGHDYTIEEQHLAFVEMDRRKREIAEERERVDFVQNYGMMQYSFGVPDADPPLPPGSVPYPGDAPDWDPWPGGLPQYLSPLEAYIDQDIHLTEEGYAILARRALDLYVEAWLNYPKALQVLPLGAKSGQQQYRVVFTHAVAGVDAGDFEAFVEGGKGLKALEVVSVDPETGPAEEYVVTVNTVGVSGEVLLRVLDDDSIVRSDTGAPLGGPGAGNGVFEFNGVYTFVDIPLPEDEDFEGALLFLYMASQAYEHLLYGFSFAPDRFDANGNFLLEGNITSEPYIIPGNGLLERYEFMLLQACLERPDLDLSGGGGATYAGVRAAWERNLAQIQYTLGGAGGLADVILPGLDTVLAAYMTMGGFNEKLLVTTLITLLAGIEEFPTNIQLGGLDQSLYTYLPQWLSSAGDADGDGFTNEQEYAYFAVDGVEAYIAAALDPGITPKTGAGYHVTGDFIRIAVLDTPKYDSPFQWYRDGAPLSDDGRIVGATTRTLDILHALEEDTGLYTCAYLKPVVMYGVPPQAAVYGPIDVRVGGAMPAAGIPGLLGAVGLLAGAGFVYLRRRR